MGTGLVSILICFLFGHCIRYPRRKVLCCFLLAVFQRYTCLAILKRNFSKRSVQSFVAQRNIKCKQLIFVALFSCYSLFHCQGASWHFLLAVDKIRFCRYIIFNRPSSKARIRLYHMPAAFVLLLDLILCPHRQPLYRNAFIMVQRKCVAASHKAALIRAIEIIFACQRRAACVCQCNPEHEILFVIRLRKSIPLHCLTDLQLSALSIRGSLVRYNYGIQQTEQTCNVCLSQIIPVCRCAFAILPSAQSSRVLFHAGADKAAVRHKVWPVILPAVFIMQTVIYDCILPIVQIHVPLQSSAFQLYVFPAVQRESAGALLLSNSSNIPQRNVNRIIAGVFMHGLRQLAYACHYCYPIIRRARISIDGIRPNNNRNYGVIFYVSGRRAYFPQIILRVICSRPFHLCISRTFIRVWCKNQCTVLSVYRMSRTSGNHIRTGLVCIQPKYHIVHSLAILVYLQNAQLPLFIRNINLGTETPVKLVNIQETEPFFTACAWFRNSHNPLGNRIDRLIPCAALIPYDISQCNVFFVVVSVFRVNLANNFHQCFRRNQRVFHTHICLFRMRRIVHPVAQRIAGQICQRALQMVFFLIPDQMPVGSNRPVALFLCLCQQRALIQHSLQRGNPPFINIICRAVHSSLPLQIVAVNRFPCVIFLLLHGYRHSKPVSLRLFGNCLVPIHFHIAAARIIVPIGNILVSRNVGNKAGVRACCPTVRHSKQIGFLVKFKYNGNRQHPVALRCVHFFQNIIMPLRAVRIIKIREIERNSASISVYYTAVYKIPYPVLICL